MNKIKLAIFTLLTICVQSAFAQTITVSGNVSDTDDVPLPGANIIIKGTAKGTQSDFDGNYVLDIAKGDLVVISYTGFVTKEILYDGGGTLNVTLENDIAQLETIVVTGYSSQSTRDITGSVAVIDVKELQKTAPLTIEQALQGQASGVTVTSQGGPGGGAAVRIRGFSSLNGADPLYVIDGTPTSSGINDLNPADIESIQVLKDAASSAIYGNRAAGGVIIVTTKKGKRNQKTKFSLNSWTGIDYIPNSALPDLASPQQLANAEFQKQRNSGTANPSHPQYGGGATPVLPNFIIPIGAATADLSNYSLENPISRANKEGTDWFGAYFSPAVVHNTNISISGGSDDANFYTGFGILDQEGVGLETYYRRYNARLNSNYSVTDKFRIGQNLNFSYSENVQFNAEGDDSGFNNAIIGLYRLHPLIPVRDVFGGFSGTRASNLGSGRNPIATAIQGRDNKDNRFRTTGAFFAELDLVKGLTAKTNLGIDYTTSERRTFNPSRFFDETVKIANDLTERVFTNSTYNWFNTLTYDSTIADKHDITALLGTELLKFRNKELRGKGQNLPFEDDLDTQFLDLAETTTSEGDGDKSALFSVFGKVDYKFDDRYLLSASIRRDASSKFGAEDNEDLRVGYFPAVSAGWRVSGENFMSNSNVITNLLLKAGYGELGNDAIPSNLDINTTGQSSRFDSFPLGGSTVQGTALSGRGNPLITWETKETINVGFDLTLIDKIDIGFEYYSSKTRDVLSTINGDSSIFGNANETVANAGDVSNKGFDLNLGFSDETSGGFSYRIGANISAYKNEVEVVDPNNDEAQILGTPFAFDIGSINNTKKGEPIGSFFGLNYLGIDQTTGRARFEDLDGNGEINGDDRKFIGSPHPDFTYGINLSADYKNFDLSILLQGSQGNDIYNLTRVFTETSIFDGAKSVDYVNAWTPTNTGARIPQLTTDPDANTLERQGSSFFVEDGSYFRLKNVQLGYTLPKTVSNHLNLERLRIYIQAKNLVTFTDYSGLDPEISVRNFNNDASASDPRSNNVRSLGVDSGTYPIARTILFGINLSL